MDCAELFPDAVLGTPTFLPLVRGLMVLVNFTQTSRERATCVRGLVSDTRPLLHAAHCLKKDHAVTAKGPLFHWQYDQQWLLILLIINIQSTGLRLLAYEALQQTYDYWNASLLKDCIRSVSLAREVPRYPLFTRLRIVVVVLRSAMREPGARNF